MSAPLPIDDALPALRDALRARSVAVLQAPPGAGKTTRVPLALLEEPWLGRQRIVMLEPRRLAARAAAHRMSVTLGEGIGRTVGYRVRNDTRVSAATRIEVVTEGVLTRMLQSDPALDGIGLVIFDEFHERSLNADLGLALALQTQRLLRDELRLLVMSATLDGAPVARLLGDAPMITSEGRSYPVDTRYLARRADVRVERAAAAAVRTAVERDDGDLLVFLPGSGEIRRTAALLDGALSSGIRVLPLHGSMPPAAQDAAIAPSPPGSRKVVLASAIAETSLTIEGVRIVVDSGLSRVPRWSPRTAMTRLETVRVSRASADQRRGRAGRVAPGVCYRLWDEAENAALPPFATPEILEADLAPLALELADAGVDDAASLAWLDRPPAAALAQGRELLAQLGALDASGRITSHGRRMATLATHPRLAHMLIVGASTGDGAVAADLVALLGDRDILRAEGKPPDADLRLRLDALRDGARADTIHGHTVDRDARRRADEEARRWRRELRLPPDERGDATACGMLLALAYPDRIAQRRADGRFLLRNGRGAAFAEPQLLSSAPYLAIAELDGQQRDSRILLAAPVDLADLEARLGAQIVQESVVEWDESAGSARAWRRARLGALVLREAPDRDPDPDPAAVAAVLLAALAADGFRALPWSEQARGIQRRVAFLRALDASWPDLSDDALAVSSGSWLAPRLQGLRRLDEVRRLDLARLLADALTWEQRAALDRLAPTHVTVPSGSRVAIDYADPSAPVLAVRLQELFGLGETPRIADGSVPLILHLLSPARRPVQVTRDLANFWRTGYFTVRKELKGRYPKHYWPDDPLVAEPRRGVRR